VGPTLANSAYCFSVSLAHSVGLTNFGEKTASQIADLSYECVHTCARAPRSGNQWVIYPKKIGRTRMFLSPARMNRIEMWRSWSQFG
jgi:hypothetical protein